MVLDRDPLVGSLGHGKLLVWRKKRGERHWARGGVLKDLRTTNSRKRRIEKKKNRGGKGKEREAVSAREEDAMAYQNHKRSGQGGVRKGPKRRRKIQSPIKRQEKRKA